MIPARWSHPAMETKRMGSQRNCSVPQARRRAAVCVVAHVPSRDVAVSAASAPTAPAARTSKCPFSGLAALLPHQTVPAPPTPVGKAGGPQNSNPHLWLAAGIAGQNVPNRLVAGIRKLDPKVSDWLGMCSNWYHVHATQLSSQEASGCRLGHMLMLGWPST